VQTEVEEWECVIVKTRAALEPQHFAREWQRTEPRSHGRRIPVTDPRLAVGGGRNGRETR
jgi:hypothetical protein